MRWHDTLILISIGALLWGAYLSLSGAQTIMLSRAGVDRAYHDTYYVIAHAGWITGIFGAVAIALALHVALIRRAEGWLPGLGALAIVALVAGIILSTWPQNVLARAAMPRRYVDYPDAFAIWNTLSWLGVRLAALALIVLLTLSAIVILQRIRRR